MKEKIIALLDLADDDKLDLIHRFIRAILLKG